MPYVAHHHLAAGCPMLTLCPPTETAFVTSLSDFCLWGPPDANSTVADEEAAAVAYWCVVRSGSSKVTGG